MPAATRALPPDQAITSAGMTSMRSVGFDSGSTMGRSTPAHRVSMTSRVKAPWSVEVPIRMVGLVRRTTSSSPIPRVPRSQSATSAAGRA